MAAQSFSIVMVGAGAMGSLFAARLAEAGARVAVVDNSAAVVDAVTEGGITLADDRGARRVAVTATRDARTLQRADLVIVFVKGMHTAGAAASVAHLADGQCHALTLQNGLGHDDCLAQCFGKERTLLGVTDQPADLVAPGEVHAPGVGSVRLGGLHPDAANGAQAAADWLSRAGFTCELLADPLIAVWEKAAFNAALNALAAVAGLTVGEMNCDEGRRIAGAIAAEAATVANGAGIAASLERINHHIDFALRNHGGHRASMLQDIEAGRPTEIETINGAIARQAAALGIAAPVNATLLDLVRLVERKATAA